PSLRRLFFLTDPPTTPIYTLSLHDALPISDLVDFAGRRLKVPANPTSQLTEEDQRRLVAVEVARVFYQNADIVTGADPARTRSRDRKSTRLNSSHVEISYAVFCLKKKKKTK